MFDGIHANVYAALEAAEDARPVTEGLAALGAREYALTRQSESKPMLISSAFPILARDARR